MQNRSAKPRVNKPIDGDLRLQMEALSQWIKIRTASSP